MNPSQSRRLRPLTDLPANLAPDRVALVAELRRGRASVQLSLEELARQVYSSKATVSRWLKGQSLPSEEQASTWAQVCGTDEAVMLQLLAAAKAPPGREAEGAAQFSPAESAEGAVAAVPPPEGLVRAPAPRGRRRAFNAVSVIIGIVAAAAVALGITWILASQRHTAACDAPYPLTLQIPPQTGSRVGVAVEAVCDVPSDRTYLVIEKLSDVDPHNPHPAYYVKATIPHLATGQASSQNFVLREPVGTRAQFWVISVDNGGLEEIKQNQVADHGILYLPSGAIQETLISWHTKGWE